MLLVEPGGPVFFVLPFRLFVAGCGFPGDGLQSLVFTGCALPVLKGFRAGYCLSLLIIGGNGDKGCNGLLMGLGLMQVCCGVVGVLGWGDKGYLT